MQLIVGNISTWSMRAWMCLKLAELDFEEIVIPLATEDYREQLSNYSETMLVPVLRADNFLVHDSLAIAEYANELSIKSIFPSLAKERAIARSLCSELHSGFMTIRSMYPFSWNALPVDKAAEEVENEIARLTYIWSKAIGSYYFSQPSVVDAFYSVLAYRLQRYGILLSGAAGEYQKSLTEWPLFTSCIERAKKWV